MSKWEGVDSLSYGNTAESEKSIADEVIELFFSPSPFHHLP